MKQKAIVWIVLALVTEKILQHGLTALLFVVNIGGIGKPDAGYLAFVGDPAMAVLNLIVMGFFVWGFWDIWKLRSRGLHLAILFSLFDIVAEFVIHGFGFITASVIVAIFLVCFALALKRIGLKPSGRT